MNTLPKISLAYLPTPVEPLDKLSAFLAGPRLFSKRDDMTGLAFGGNKTRKLEYLLADALESGAGTLITAGAVQSNHCRQTAAAAAKAGLKCILVLAGEPLGAPSGNVLLDLLLGAELVWAGSRDRDKALKETFEAAEEAGARPYLIPYGGSSALGAAAYAFAVAELLEQAPAPDWIVFPTSSGGTQAGLVAGVRLLAAGTQILGISVDEPAITIQNRVAGLASEICSLVGDSQDFDPQSILVNDKFIGAGYGIAGPLEREAIELFARLEGILVDPVYTGRAAAGLFGLVRGGFFSSSDDILFWHTGGTPALFAEAYQELYNEAQVDPAN
ncbi:MAG: D-cysteine desulfhydrase family protein [Anaerolineales bacterium]|nr:D-cysteine desulfhydrase family protein [Anaerolineales bacterium]